jgi:hypothetical protein
MKGTIGKNDDVDAGSNATDKVMGKADDLQRLEDRVTSVPGDFPWNPTPASLAGAQPKLVGRMIGGTFVVGLTAQERFDRWRMCEDLAQQLVPKLLKDAAKFPEHSHDVTLRRMRCAIERKRWTEGAETDWLIERLRVLLSW